jgi:GMP synthase (glutamine-hydrolysing)
MILIIDFGSQTTHLISRRIGELGVRSKIVIPEVALKEISNERPKGIILSGGPATVFEKGAPSIDKAIFSLQIPILGICYGQQLTAYLLGGKTAMSSIKEYGPVQLSIKKSPLFKNIFTPRFNVWMSHGVEVTKLPKGYSYIAHTENIKAGAIAHETKKIYGVQFHPEVQHTQYGMEILKNFLNICGEKSKSLEIDIKGIIANIKEIIGDKKVVMALSGGTDSFVAAALIAKAVGKQLIPVYVDSGLMRKNAKYNVSVLFPKLFGIQPKTIKAEQIFLKSLKHIIDPEKKRKTIGVLYVRLFEKIAAYSHATFLGQGTTYADFIHSKSTKHAALIKSHHNVGGLPKKMKLKLLEPIRYFYTDQVRFIGKKLGLPEQIIKQQPFPGPGFAVRILGEVTKEKLIKVKMADNIVMEEIEKAGLKDSIFQYFAIVTNAKSTAIKGDGRFYGDVIAVRAYTTKDRMTADWAKIPYDVLQKISARIVNEVPKVSRVVYDITTKPPATMEWE